MVNVFDDNVTLCWVDFIGSEFVAHHREEASSEGLIFSYR